jgi:hypothetical protein
MTDTRRYSTDAPDNSNQAAADWSPLQFDHLIIAAKSLQAGIDHVETLLQVPLKQGGQHVNMGTHNGLLRLGDNCYLEVISIDPSLSIPGRSRWFGLDSAEIRKQISKSPRLIHWVARTNDFKSISDKIPAMFGRIINMSRGDLNWKITVPDDGSLPADGILPSMIQWLSATHPASMLPDRKCRLRSLEATLPNVYSAKHHITAMGLQEFIKILPGAMPQLKATIETPSGLQIVV